MNGRGKREVFSTMKQNVAKELTILGKEDFYNNKEELPRAKI